MTSVDRDREIQKLIYDKNKIMKGITAPANRNVKSAVNSDRPLVRGVISDY